MSGRGGAAGGCFGKSVAASTWHQGGVGRYRLGSRDHDRFTSEAPWAHFAPQPDVGRGEHTPCLLAWICENTYRRPPSQSPCHHASVYRDHVGTLERPRALVRTRVVPLSIGGSCSRKGWSLGMPKDLQDAVEEGLYGRVTGSFARIRTPQGHRRPGKTRVPVPFPLAPFCTTTPTLFSFLSVFFFFAGACKGYAHIMRILWASRHHETGLRYCDGNHHDRHETWCWRCLHT